MIDAHNDTEKLCPKLDAYMVLQRKECKGVEVYMGSSNQFKTQKAYKNWLLAQDHLSHLTIKIVKP